MSQKLQRTLGCDAGVQLTQRSVSGIACIRENLLALAVAQLILALEIVLTDVDLAMHFKLIRPVGTFYARLAARWNSWACRGR